MSSVGGVALQLNAQPHPLSGTRERGVFVTCRIQPEYARAALILARDMLCMAQRN